MIDNFSSPNKERQPAFSESTLASARIAGFHFKCEGFSEDGHEIGPVYAVLRDKAELRSMRYVTLTDAMKLAKFYGVELVES